MQTPISPTGGPGAGSSPMGAPKDDVARMLEGIPVKPGDEKILDTPFGKMITKFAAPDTDKKTLIREVKKALEQYVQSLTAEMKRQMKRSEEAIKKMGKVSRGERED